MTMLRLFERREITDDVSATVKTFQDKTKPSATTVFDFGLHNHLFTAEYHALPFKKIVETSNERPAFVDVSNLPWLEDWIGRADCLLVNFCALRDFKLIRKMYAFPVWINPKQGFCALAFAESCPDWLCFGSK